MVSRENKGERQRINEEEIDFYSLLPGVLSRVKLAGDIKEMVSWRKAYPDIDFMDVDNYYHMGINWDEKTPLERAIYVALMQDESRDSMRMEVGLSCNDAGEPGLMALLENGTYQDKDKSCYEILGPAEIFWWHWVAGSFKALDLEGKLDEAMLPETAKRGLVGDYLSAIPMSGDLRQRLEGWFEHLTDNFNKIKLERLKVRVKKQ